MDLTSAAVSMNETAAGCDGDNDGGRDVANNNKIITFNIIR